MYSPFASASILYTTPRKAAGHGRGGVWYLILLLSLFFNPSVLRTPPLYFAAQNTEEEGWEVTFSSYCFVASRNAARHGRGRGLVLDFVAADVLLTPPSFASPIFCVAKHPVMLRVTARGEDWKWDFSVLTLLPCWAFPYILLRKYWGSGGNSAFVMRVLPCKENKYFILSDKKHRKC